jgi:hypothetical protein
MPTGDDCRLTQAFWKILARTIQLFTATADSLIVSYGVVPENIRLGVLKNTTSM